MENHIKTALSEAYEKLQKLIPQTKKTRKRVDILDVIPSDLPSFMQANNIPECAEFDPGDNGYDGGEGVFLSWLIEVPTTEKDRIYFARHRFTSLAFMAVGEVLRSAGYRRAGATRTLLKSFDNTSVYDMYLEKDYGRLVEWFLLFYSKDGRSM